MASIEEVKAALLHTADQGKQPLAEAATSVQGSAAAAHAYVSVLG